MNRWYLFAGALAECFSLVALLMLTQYSGLMFLLLHALASYWMAWGLWQELPRRLKLPVRRSVLFLLVLLFILPVISFVGLYFGLLKALKKSRLEESRAIEIVPMPDLPFSPPQVHSSPPYSQGALMQIVQFAQKPLKRLKAVMATRRMSAREAMKVWTLATRDRVDDVRLLAFSMIDSKEKWLTDKITELSDELNELAPKLRGEHHKALGELCWELVYHRLVHGAVREHWIAQAERHLEQSLRFFDCASTWKLLGRLKLMKGELDEAERAFNRCATLGLNVQSLLSFRAEIAFRRGQFNDVRALMMSINASGEMGRDLAQVKSWWAL